MTRTDWKKKYWELQKKHLEMEQAFIETARELTHAHQIIKDLREKLNRKKR